VKRNVDEQVEVEDNGQDNAMGFVSSRLYSLLSTLVDRYIPYRLFCKSTHFLFLQELRFHHLFSDLAPHPIQQTPAEKNISTCRFVCPA
jgi:hypothetical protein